MSTMRSSLAEAIASVPSTTSVEVLCDELRAAGLLGVADVTFLKKTLSAPVTMGQVERLLLSQNEPARRAQIEKVINDAAARIFASFLAREEMALQILDLSANRLTDDGASLLASSAAKSLSIIQVDGDPSLRACTLR